MRSNRPRDTGPEMAVRSALHREGLRFRKHLRPVAGLACTVDIVFPVARLAIFVDGCYWHACPEHGSYPRTNAAWWRAKLDGTRERDRRNARSLAMAGWYVMRVWEHEDVSAIVYKVQQCLYRIRISRSGGALPRDTVAKVLRPGSQQH